MPRLVGSQSSTTEADGIRARSSAAIGSTWLTMYSVSKMITLGQSSAARTTSSPPKASVPTTSMSGSAFNNARTRDLDRPPSATTRTRIIVSPRPRTVSRRGSSNTAQLPAPFGSSVFAALSDDDGSTWKHHRNLDGVGGYMAMTQSPDGMMHVFGTRMGAVTFNEAWLREGKALR